MVSYTSLALAGLSVVAAQQCQNLTLSVTTNATNSVINSMAPYPQNQTQVTAFITSYLQQPQPQAMTFINGTFQNQQTYNITATYCPSTAANASTNAPLQILIHGIGFDKSYWDFTNGTSYVRQARAAGYDTLAFDRLGCGSSSKPDGRMQVQTATQVDIARAITQQARLGLLPGVNKTYNTTVHVGHSYGSIITTGLVSLYPNITQGIVLTGYSINSTWLPQTIASWNPKSINADAPTRFGNTTNTYLNNTYLTWSDIYNNQLAFFKFPYYNESILTAGEAAKQPVTYGEIITLGSAPGNLPSPNYRGLVHVVNGNNDFIFCGGNCSATGLSNVTSVASSVSMLYPNAKSFSEYIAPNTGHAVQLHNSGQNTTREIQSYLLASL